MNVDIWHQHVVKLWIYLLCHDKEVMARVNLLEVFLLQNTLKLLVIVTAAIEKETENIENDDHNPVIRKLVFVIFLKKVIIYY